MLGFNVILLLLFYLIRREYVQPASRIIEEACKLFGLESAQAFTHSLRGGSAHFSRAVGTALSLAQDKTQLQQALIEAHDRIRQLMRSQQGMCVQTLSESQHLFSTVDAYADYLEELVASELVRDGVREDYDEVMEASHNLRFLIQGMTNVVQIETQLRPLKQQHTDIALLLGRYLMLLTPALERRAMKVNSARCRETLPYAGDESAIGHILWALLTTCLHYAEDDTTLHVEGFTSSESIEMRFFVMVSSPASLSKRERDAYLKAMESSNAEVHMFLHTMRQYPNLQLAERLAHVIGGQVDCMPDGDYRCILTLSLPLTAKTLPTLD